MPLLEVQDLSVAYRVDGGTLHAVRGVSMEVGEGESLGLVGESGCGKTTLAKSLLKVLPPNGRITAGGIRLKGRDLVPLTEARMRKIRWKDVAMVFQSAMNALDPVYRIQDQIVEAIKLHRKVVRREALRRAAELFDLVGIDRKRLRDYSHQFSGGMRQRACIAIALAVHPSLLVADEPTTALDVIVKDEILERITTLQKDLRIALIYVSHDISVVAETCGRVAVMYAGEIVEYGGVATVFSAPVHPYTMGLLNAFPRLAGDQRLVAIPGYPPNLMAPPRGCAFAARCPFAEDVCTTDDPPLHEVSSGHAVACHFAGRAEEFRGMASQRETWQRHGAAAGGTQ
ncbi:MAG: ABC transporter ATP-binding protein [Nitrospinota bacterium]|jgi:oligopeptide/dipeptide ABC transporter ATP-binding protein|nr:ABC transporter ATP-binding protein [Nitrospinota bacterium]MDP7385826.1 ABC transporter ATP-binding protein [Nitrospinota bacterium]